VVDVDALGRHAEAVPGVAPGGELCCSAARGRCRSWVQTPHGTPLAPITELASGTSLVPLSLQAAAARARRGRITG